MGIKDYFYNQAQEPLKQKKFQPFNEEFSLDYSTEPFGSSLSYIDNTYANNGVELQDARSVIRILYQGILSKNGAQQIYAVMGYGDNWDLSSTYHLHKNGSGQFELFIPIVRTGNLNFAFKDDAENWDNNNQRNYSFKNIIFEGQKQ
jgi:hypothetical protein